MPYVVEVPIAGYVSIEIEDANSEEEAIQKAFERGYKDEDIQEIEMYKHIVKGNVCHVRNSVRVYKYED